MRQRRPSKPDDAQPLVFISHDTRDADLAEAFENLLHDASAGLLRCFRSSAKSLASGIPFGQEWYAAVMGSLNAATELVALITPNSMGRPWLLYEAGVVAGRRNSPVIGLAIGLSLEQASTGPFGQLQNLVADEDSLTKLVLTLLVDRAAPREETTREFVRRFLSEVASIQQRTPADATATAPGAPRQAVQVEESPDSDRALRLFEEIKQMFRLIDRKLDRLRVAPVHGASSVPGPYLRELLSLRARGRRDAAPEVAEQAAVVIQAAIKEEIFGNPRVIALLTPLEDALRNRDYPRAVAAWSQIPTAVKHRLDRKTRDAISFGLTLLDFVSQPLPSGEAPAPLPTAGDDEPNLP